MLDSTEFIHWKCIINHILEAHKRKKGPQRNAKDIERITNIAIRRIFRGESLKDIAKEYCLSKERIRQIANEIKFELEKLRI